MPLVKSPQTIEELSKFDDYFETSGTQCWQVPSGNILLYLFSKIYDTAADLQKNYKELRDHVAISFQSRTLTNPAERWNLYIIYFVKENVPQEIKQSIIQDKFSARKVICSIKEDLINDDYLNSTIEKKLINITIPVRQTSTDNLSSIISEQHPKVAQVIDSIGSMSSRDRINDLINFLADE